MIDEQHHPYRTDVLRELTDENDVFGHRDYAKTLCNAVQTVTPPFTLGLLGPWGTGKSSILDTAFKEINRNDKDVAAVVFDAWKFEGNTLRREFVREIGERLKEQGDLKAGFKLDKHLESLDADVVDFKTTVRSPTKKALLWAGLLGLVAAVPFYLLLKSSEDVGFQTLGGALLAFLLSVLASVVRVEEVQVSENRLQDPDEFARSFEGLLSNGLKAKRLVIGIDNLDRCSPERVAELLGTIKTFLEPAKAPDKELVFVIAADDGALKRHLTAQELSASGGPEAAGVISQGEASTDSQTEDAGLPADVRDAVEEYLRKFFTGILRINDLLEGDVRTFARNELAPFIAMHVKDTKAASQLTELIAMTLKRNPRRIMQFINGLELRLELLKQRQASNRISSNEAPNVLLVAKVAIIEEHFPERYIELKRNPSKLGHWHTQAREGDLDTADRDWRTFLHYSSQISGGDLRRYVNLQQSEEERRLPRYREFVDLLEAGDSDVVDEFLLEEEIAPDADEYRAKVQELIRANMRANFELAAVEIVRVAVEAEELEPIASEVLSEALGIAELRAPLADISPGSLLDRAAHLDVNEFNLAVEVALQNLGKDEEGAAEDRKVLCEALSKYVEKLDPSNFTRIQDSLRSDVVKDNFESYLPLVEAEPSLGSTDNIDAGLAELEGRTPITRDRPAYRLVGVLLKAHKAGEKHAPAPQLQKLTELVTQSLFELQASDEDAYRELALDAASILDHYAGANIQLGAWADRFEAEWPQIPPALQDMAFEFMTAVLDAGAQEQRDGYAAAWTGRFFDENPLMAAGWAGGKSGNYGDAVQDHAEQRLALMVCGNDASVEAVEKATDVILGLDGTDRQRLLLRACDLGVQHGHYRRAAALLEQYWEELQEDRARLAQALLDQANAQGAAEEESLLAIAGLDPGHLDNGQVRLQETVIANAAKQGTESWAKAFEAFSAHRDSDVKAVVEELLTYVLSQAQTIENHLPQVDLIASQAEPLSLGSDRLRQFGRALIESINRLHQGPQGGQWIPALSSAIARLSKAESDDRRDWVSDLIQREREQGDLSIREALLSAAHSLAGPHGAARDEVKERLKELRKSDSDDEKALADRIEPNR